MVVVCCRCSCVHCGHVSIPVLSDVRRLRSRSAHVPRGSVHGRHGETTGTTQHGQRGHTTDTNVIAIVTSVKEDM